MNRRNLKRMADYIRTIPQEQFTMAFYSEAKSGCGTVGCVIGHCVEFDEFAAEVDIKSSYSEWSEEFTQLPVSSNEWKWCFSSKWWYRDDTPIGASLRIEWLLNHGLPENWEEQMNGEAYLDYLEKVQTDAYIIILNHFSGSVEIFRWHFNISGDLWFWSPANKEGFKASECSYMVSKNLEINTSI